MLTRLRRSSMSGGDMLGRALVVAAVIAAILVLLTACGAGSPPVTAGTIVAVDHSLAHDETVPIDLGCLAGIPVGTTGITVCTVRNTIDDTTHYPEAWSLQLRACADNSAGHNHCRTGWVDVTEGQYTSARVGDTWPPNP